MNAYPLTNDEIAFHDALAATVVPAGNGRREADPIKISLPAGLAGEAVKTEFARVEMLGADWVVS